MNKLFGIAVIAATMLIASPVFAGGKACCAKGASHDKPMCTDLASLHLTSDQQTKIEAWQSECMKAGCTEESRARFLKQARGILSADQYAKLKAECDASAKNSKA